MGGINWPKSYTPKRSYLIQRPEPAWKWPLIIAGPGCALAIILAFIR
jgi:hypothetical protein